MTSSPLPPGDRPTLRSVLPVPVCTVVLAALAVTAAALLGPESARGALAAAGALAALALCVAVTVATYAVLSARTARDRLEAATQEAGRLLQERARLTDAHAVERKRLVDAHGAERKRLADAHAAEVRRLATEHAAELSRRDDEHSAFADKLTAEYAEERDGLAAQRDRLIAETARLTARTREANSSRAAALSATANAAGRMQALSTGMLADLRAMEERHQDEEVLADLFHLDHRTAQAGRLADSVAVLTGARSGRRWARPITMESVLRGAMGRISGYRRVRVHSAGDTAVAGHAAEGVMHALAELLDNAATFSPPTAEVHVYVEEVPAGVIVSIEDSGLVMGEAQLRRAERAVTGEAVELGGLTGTRLGLAVVGRLARRYGLRVSYRPSARGGTGVLVLVPQEILVSPGGPALPAPHTGTGTETAASTPPPAAARATDTGPSPRSAAPSLPRRGDTDTATKSRTAGSPDDADSPDSAGSPHSAGSPGTDSAQAPLVLPRRRRGETLAEAERAHSGGVTPSRPAPTAAETRARTARFHTFRQAVRAVNDGQSAESTLNTPLPRQADGGAGTNPLAPTPGPTPGSAAETLAEAPAADATALPTPPSPEGDTTP
ncbi:ATP-binding protein [Streptomyces sp. NPDC047046]|uniref:sensor histidine kinase n=1 Tax=Streptomyces sp. NPDC047046 TaxID=3155378 RepID=UPI0033C2595E